MRSSWYVPSRSAVGKQDAGVRTYDFPFEGHNNAIAREKAFHRLLGAGAKTSLFAQGSAARITSIIALSRLDSSKERVHCVRLVRLDWIRT